MTPPETTQSSASDSAPDEGSPLPTLTISPGAFRMMGCLVLFIIFVMIVVVSYYVFSSRMEAQTRPLAEALMEQFKAGDVAGAAAQIGERALGEERPDYAARLTGYAQQFGALKKWEFEGSMLHRLPDGRIVDLGYTGTFEKGTVDIWIQAVRRGEAPWRLSYLEFREQPIPTWPGTKPDGATTPTLTATPVP